MSGWVAASQRPALAMMVRMMERTFGVSVEVACQRSTQLVQSGSRAFDERGGVVAGAHRRIAVPQRRDAALEGIKDRQLVAARRRMRPEAGEGLGAQVLERGAAINQQRLAHDASKVVASHLRDPIAPGVERRCHLGDRGFDGVGAEDERGEVQAVERPELLEAVEA